jgi:cation:H+ antiporter
MPALFLIIGLLILGLGAELLIRGSSAIAARFGMSDLLIGLTIVAFGTSAPELAVSIKAAIAQQGGIALGNVIGSNIFNAALILGLTAFITPLTVSLQTIRRELPILLPVTILFAALIFLQDDLGRVSGTVLFIGLLVYLWFSFRHPEVIVASQEPLPQDVNPPGSLPSLVCVVLILAGLAMLVFGARLFVAQAVLVATALGVSEAVIGLTIVAAGTSLPELAASVTAALRGKADMAIGNIVGSNLFNILGIAGLSAMVRPLATQGIGWLDLTAMLITSAVLLPFFRTNFQLSRWEGAALIACFATYLFLLWPR